MSQNTEAQMKRSPKPSHFAFTIKRSAVRLNRQNRTPISATTSPRKLASWAREYCLPSERSAETENSQPAALCLQLWSDEMGLENIETWKLRCIMERDTACLINIANQKRGPPPSRWRCSVGANAAPLQAEYPTDKTGNLPHKPERRNRERPSA